MNKQLQLLPIDSIKSLNSKAFERKLKILLSFLIYEVTLDYSQANFSHSGEAILQR